MDCEAIASAFFGIGVVDRSELRRAALGIKPRVIFPDMTHADDADPKCFHRRVKLENCSDMREAASEPQR